jgi:hypothetical protein
LKNTARVLCRAERAAPLSPWPMHVRKLSQRAKNLQPFFYSVENSWRACYNDTMRKLIAFSFVFSLLSLSRVFAAEWLANFEDVPHMQNVYAIEDDGFVYSIPDGKIIQTTVASDVISRRQFQRFYRDALYELGWEKTSENKKSQAFRRDGEELIIDILDEKPFKARFTLTPTD